MSFQSFDPDIVGAPTVYSLMIGGIVPRPIAWISTRSAKGELNLAPFSFFMGVSSRPPCLAFSVTRKRDGDKKDTLLNIEATSDFVVNSAQEEMADSVNQTSAEYPYGVSEFEKIGLTPLASIRVSPPRVAESAVQMECRLEKLVEIGDGGLGSSVIVVGRIVQIHVDTRVLREGTIDIHALKPLSRLGGIEWGCTDRVFEQKRPVLNP